MLAVYWLEVDEHTPARDEYLSIPNKPQVLAALTTIDNLLCNHRPVPKRRWESFICSNIRLYEIKAPPVGRSITRLLAYRESDWNMFVALVRQKKSQSLPEPWKTVAADRVKRALAEGGML